MARILASMRQYLRTVWLDYYEVLKEVRRDACNKPLKASAYGIATIFVINLFRTNEGLKSYSAEIVSACNRVGSVVDKCRNPTSKEFVQNIGELHCQGLLRQLDLGFSTLIYKADSNQDIALYRYNCSHLRPSLKEFIHERLVDLGIQGRWLILESKMKNYDINEDEYIDSKIN